MNYISESEVEYQVVQSPPKKGVPMIDRISGIDIKVLKDLLHLFFALQKAVARDFLSFRLCTAGDRQNHVCTSIDLHRSQIFHKVYKYS